MRAGNAIALLAVLGSCSWAQEATKLTLEAAIGQAIAQNPELRMARAQSDVVRAQVKQAALRPNPRLTVQSEDLRPSETRAPFSFANSTEDYLLLSQTIETAGKRGRRVDVASGNASTADLQAQVTSRQIAQRVSVAYWNAALAERLTRLARQTLQTYDQDVNYLRARVKEGVVAEADAVRVELERNRLRLAALQAERERDLSVLNLYRAMGMSGGTQLELTTPLEASVTPEMPTMEEVLARRPEMGLAKQSVATAESNLRLQRALSKPDPLVSVGYKRNSGFDTAYAQLQVDLPVLNRNQGNVGSAIAQQRREQASLQMATLAIRSEYESAMRVYRSQQEMATQMPKLVDQARDSEQRARAAYREGGLDLLRLLDAERSRIQIETDYSRALADLQQAITGLRVAAGLELTGGGQ